MTNKIKNKIIVGVWSFYSEFSMNNFMLNNKGSGLGDDAFWGQNELKRKGEKKSIIFKTLDLVENWNDLDAILVFDYPKPVNQKCKISNRIVKKILNFEVPSFLVLHECSVIKPNNWILSNHTNWKKIFTWNDDYIKNKKYIKLNMPPRIVPKNWYSNKIPNKFATLIASNKKSKVKNEAYSDRLKCIEWFEKNHPDDLDLFGYGWDQYRLNGENYFFDKINKISPLMKVFGTNYKVWKGLLKSKQGIAHCYKFNFAYENAKNIPGYILEKIIDSFLLCSVPIYLGASNIEKHINDDCFIDLRNFKDYSELYKFLISVGDNEYLDYIEKIKGFIESPRFYPFSADCYTDTIITTISTELKNINKIG